MPSMNPGRKLMLAGQGKLLQHRHETKDIKAIHLHFVSTIVVHFAQVVDAALHYNLRDILAQAGANIQRIGSPLPRGMFRVGATQ